VLRRQVHSTTMRLPSRLEDERKSCVIPCLLFRQSPKSPSPLADGVRGGSVLAPAAIIDWGGAGAMTAGCERRTLTPFDTYRLESRLEALCEKGCRRVRQDIDALDRGEDLPETRGLSAEERRLLLRELKQVMAVYADRCSVS
jgi:hypothetical protein